MNIDIFNLNAMNFIAYIVLVLFNYSHLRLVHMPLFHKLTYS